MFQQLSEVSNLNVYEKIINTIAGPNVRGVGGEKKG